MPSHRAPTNLKAASGKGKKVSVAWTASSDDIGVATYVVYRNGNVLGTSSGTSYNDTLSGKLASASYYVVARDAAGNVSPASNSVTVAG
jgi:hypothetical protein